MSDLTHIHNWIIKEWKTIEEDYEPSGNNQYTSCRTVKSGNYVTKVICLECGEEMNL